MKLPKSEKVTQTRQNGKHPVLKEEEGITSVLKDLKDNNRITEALHNKLKPVGSQPPHLYGLAKVHKENSPIRPVLSMPGSSYYKIASQYIKLVIM